MWISWSVLTVFPKLWKGPSERRWVGLGFCPFCTVTVLRAGVDGFTRLSYFCGVFCSCGAVGRVVIWSGIFNFFLPSICR